MSVLRGYRREWLRFESGGRRLGGGRRDPHRHRLRGAGRLPRRRRLVRVDPAAGRLRRARLVAAAHRQPRRRDLCDGRGHRRSARRWKRRPLHLARRGARRADRRHQHRRGVCAPRVPRRLSRQARAGRLHERDCDQHPARADRQGVRVHAGVGWDPAAAVRVSVAAPGDASADARGRRRHLRRLARCAPLPAEVAGAARRADRGRAPRPSAVRWIARVWP